jgi:hypothetical protein
MQNSVRCRKKNRRTLSDAPILSIGDFRLLALTTTKSGVERQRNEQCGGYEKRCVEKHCATPFAWPLANKNILSHRWEKVKRLCGGMQKAHPLGCALRAVCLSVVVPVAVAVSEL